MMKRIARACLAGGCRAAALLSLAERSVRGRLVILCYHRVLPADRKATYPLPGLVVTPESFRRQCLALRRHYEVLPLHQAVRAVHAGSFDRRPLAAITFDDGYRDNFRYAAPILREMRLGATFFVIAGLVGTNEVPWYDRLGWTIHTLQRQNRARSALAACGRVDLTGDVRADDAESTLPQQVVARAKGLTPAQRAALLERLCGEVETEHSLPADDLIMDWQQLTDLLGAGHEIGSHGQSHEILPALDDASLAVEVAGSRRILEEGLGRPVRSFCYPNGDVDERVAQAVTTAGYDCAVTVESGSNDREGEVYRLRRRFIHEDRLTGPGGTASDALLRMELCGLADRVFRRRGSHTAYS